MVNCLVLLSSYNGEKYLKEQIDSILNQPFEYDYINYTDSYNQECLLTCNLELNEDSIRDIFKSLKDKFPEYLL